MNRSLLNQKYIPLRKVAAGGMGEIYLAQQIGAAGFQREVILKAIHRRLCEHPKAVAMFLDEAKLAAKLSHPNVVQIYDVGEEEGRFFIVMERISGASLRDLAERATQLGRMIPMELSLTIIMQVLEGLRYAHAFRDETGRPLKIVHRDICPTNILVSFEGGVKLVDFGIARATDQLRDEGGQLPGKLAYMAPEALRGESVDARADLYGAGILLYELTVGQRLYRATTLQAMRRIVEEPINPPTYARAGYPVDLEIIVMRALERDPEDRFASAEEMLEQLEDFVFSTGMRNSRLRLGRFVSEVMGVTTSALDFDALPAEDEVVPEPTADELDFDREGIFEPAVAPAQPIDEAALAGDDEDEDEAGDEDEDDEPTSALDPDREQQVLAAVRDANEALAEFVKCSAQTAAQPALEEQEEERAADGDELAGDELDEDDEEETVEIKPTDRELLVAQTVSAIYPEPVELEPEARKSRRGENSTVVVTDELVEEEFYLSEAQEELLLEPPLRLAPQEPAAQDAADDSSLPVTKRVQREAVGLEVEEAAPPVIEEASRPEASTEVKEALAEISAELRAAEESDRQRTLALAQIIDQLDEPTPIPALQAPQPPQLAAPQDELERVDGQSDRRLDELELAEAKQPRSLALGGRAYPEDDDDDDAIVLLEDDSAIEMEVEEEAEEDGLEEKTLERLPRPAVESPVEFAGVGWRRQPSKGAALPQRKPGQRRKRKTSKAAAAPSARLRTNSRQRASTVAKAAAGSRRKERSRH